MGLPGLTALQQQHRLAEESPITSSPRRSHLYSCRWILPCSHSCEIRASHVNAALWLLPRLKALLLCCQQSTKAEAGRPPKSASQSAISQPALTAVNYNVLGELMCIKVHKHSCLALSSCCIWMRLIYFPPVTPPSGVTHLPVPSLSPLFPLNLSSHVNKLDTAWQRRLPSHQPPLGARAAQTLGRQFLPCRACTPAVPALPCLQGLSPLPSPPACFTGFSEDFGPHKCNLGKDKVVGASRAVAIFTGACRGLWLVHRPSTEHCSIPPACLSSSIYLRAEQLMPCWDDVLGFRLF